MSGCRWTAVFHYVEALLQDARHRGPAGDAVPVAPRYRRGVADLSYARSFGAGEAPEVWEPRTCRSAKARSGSCATFRLTYRHPKSRTNSTSPPTPSRPICATCTPSSARTAAPRPSRTPAPWACSRPPHSNTYSGMGPMKSCPPPVRPTLVDRLGDALTGERHVADPHPDRVGDRVADNTATGPWAPALSSASKARP